MHLILCRHGNTFDKQDKVVFAGSRQDLPLVARGREQAEACGQAIKAAGFEPAAICCGPLSRTKESARIIAAQTGFLSEVTIDERLNEIDYGSWAGLSSEEIAGLFGIDMLEAWNKHSVWPQGCNWTESEKEVIAAVHSFASDLSRLYAGDETVIAVSSNGRLRYFLTLLEGEYEKRALAGTFKVGTGHVCCLQSSGVDWKLAFWNLSPEELDLNWNHTERR